MPDTLQLDTREGVHTITLNNPERLNALSHQMLQELIEAFRGAERDDEVKAVVLTGAGRAFSSGADLRDFHEETDALGQKRMGDVSDELRSLVNPLVLRLRSLEKPVLAAVNGVAAGAGMSLALAADIRYAAESASFLQAFVRIGLVPDGGSFYFLPRLVGPAKAVELAWTGDAVSATVALELGLVNRVLPDTQLLAATQELAARLAQGPLKTLGLIKRGMHQAHELGLERVLEMETYYQQVASQGADFYEGVAAFKEKRPAKFSGG
jgi:2-(1,2-epoxy-1,2-dihydrophenyl)acetyl-CoA isomerase